MKTTWSLSTALCCSGFTEGGACQISERWRGYNLKLFCIQRVGVGVPGASWVFPLFLPSYLLLRLATLTDLCGGWPFSIRVSGRFEGPFGQTETGKFVRAVVAPLASS